MQETPKTPRTGTGGKLALITGAARGIGAAVATDLATHGASIAAMDADAGELDTLTAKLTAEGHTAAAYPADVTDSADVDATVARVESAMGPIDILVNVAGALCVGPVVDLTDEDWTAVFAVNTGGVFHVSRAVAVRMQERRSGSIVTVASNAASVPRMHMSAYGASKVASVLFTKCLGLELAEYGIRCNIVSPGSTDTAMLHSMWADEQDRQTTLDGSLDSYRVGIPLRRLAQPEDVAAAVTFLASHQANHITMQELTVDGGAALRA